MAETIPACTVIWSLSVHSIASSIEIHPLNRWYVAVLSSLLLSQLILFCAFDAADAPGMFFALENPERLSSTNSPNFPVAKFAEVKTDERHRFFKAHAIWGISSLGNHARDMAKCMNSIGSSSSLGTKSLDGKNIFVTDLASCRSCAVAIFDEGLESHCHLENIRN
ncbi:hypothetical protein BJ878DRAFT_278173 [Calycina marina]|uniref:Uncharacterized protein n=1 Tax=Calycina marina TaxID=1763456 RepID=A0A9P7YVB1_9HELO|nr:hypothetical protein BJ878DRAFT_278173 [Calycina marina]